MKTTLFKFDSIVGLSISTAKEAEKGVRKGLDGG